MAHFKGVKDQLRVKVKARIPLDEGKFQTVPFVCIYKVPDVPTARQLTKDAQDGAINDQEVVDEYLVGWDKLLDENDDPIEFSPENVNDAMDLAPYARAIVGGFLELLFGREALKRKN